MAWFKKKKQRTVTVSPETSDGLRYLVENVQGIGTRQRQEDSFTLVNALDEQMANNYGIMFAVCDGMGGMRDGKIASETAIQSFRQSFSEMDRRERIAAQLKESVFAASEKVERLLDGDGGSTVVIGVILHEQLYFASVGDSYFYLKRDGKLYRLNMEQNLCHQRYLECIRNGDFDPNACRADPEAAALTQFLGMAGFSETDCSVRPMFLRQGDILLACSDGVGGVLDEQELSGILNGSAGMSRQIEQHIVDHAEPNQDNYTAIIISCI